MYGQVVSAGPVVAVHPPGGRPAEQGGALPLRLPRPHPCERRPLLSAALLPGRHTVRQAGEHARQKVSEIIVCLPICQTESTINMFFFQSSFYGLFDCTSVCLFIFKPLITFLFTGSNKWLILILIL